MKGTILNVRQGTPEWLQARAESDGTASELPAATGKSKYQSRNELLAQRKSGIAKEVDASTRALFDRGHEAEALARQIAERIIGDELSPTTVVIKIDGLRLLASLDGITFDDDVIFEHKLWNAGLADQVKNGSLEEHYTLQIDQELLVSGASKCLFMTSDGTETNCAWMWYETTAEKKAAVVATWKQFHKDLSEFVVRDVKEVKAESIMALPALSVQIRGEVVSTNLPDFKAQAEAFIASIKTDLQTDEDFAQAEANVKFCKDAEDGLEAAKKAAIAQTASIDELMRTVDHIAAQLRDKRLMLDKLVKSQKELIKAGIIAAARQKFDSIIAGLEAEIKPIRLVYAQPGFTEVIKSKRTLASLHDAVDTELSRATIEAESIARDIRDKLAWCKSNADGYGFLFRDLQQIIFKASDDFQLLVTTRIAEYKKAEEKRLEDERARIRAEEEAKAKQNDQSEDAPHKLVTGDGGAAPLNPAPVVYIQTAVVENQDVISAFMSNRDFGKNTNRIRAVLVEFVKFQEGFRIKA